MDADNSTTQPINPNIITPVLMQLSNPDNEIRTKAELILSTMKYNKDLYSTLITIFIESSVKEIKVQSLLLIKNFIRHEFYSENRRPLNINARKKDPNIMNAIYDYIKEQLLQLQSSGKYDKAYSNIIKDLFLVFTDKFFPNQWDGLNVFFESFFKLSIENILNSNLFELSLIIVLLFDSILKQFSKKKSSISRNKFLNYKSLYLESFLPYYLNVSKFFTDNMQQFIDINYTRLFLELMQLNDKILLNLIEISYNQAEFHKDQKLLEMITIIIDRTYFLLNQIDSIKEKSLKEGLWINVYKILKSSGQLQGIQPILFCKELKRFINILMLVIVHCEMFTENILKAALFSLTKVVNTQSYKEVIIKEPDISSYKSNIYDSTPEKKKNTSALSSMLSPTKYRNFDNEIKISTALFTECFTEETIKTLLDCLIKKCPFVFKKENDNLEIELLINLEEEVFPLDNFSNNLFTFQIIYKNTLDSLITNFNSIAMKYINNTLTQLYSGEYSNNYLILDSYINFINLLPSLYKIKVISLNDMIDHTKYIGFIEQYLSKSELMVKKYIVTICKWSPLLISNETVFNYINNLVVFLSNSKNEYILIETCLSIKIILDTLDRQMNQSLDNLNVLINKEYYSKLIKTKINWCNLLCLVSQILMIVLPNIQSSELLVSLIKFFTTLIQKCHFQCDGKILDSIQNSKLIDITSNITDELRENAYFDMFKNLLVSFPSSEIIAGLSVHFVTKSLMKKITLINLNFILFLVRIIESTDLTKAILSNFIKENNSLFQMNISQTNDNILIPIIEEIIIFDILDLNDVISFVSILNGKYIKSFELMKTYCDQMRSNSTNTNLMPNMKCTFDIMCTDLCETKALLLNAYISILSFYANKKQTNLTTELKMMLRIAFEEAKLTAMSKDFHWLSSVYISQMIQFITRMSLYNFELFKQVLGEFSNENNIKADEFVTEVFKIMEQVLNNEARKLNVLFITKLLPLLSYDFLYQNAKLIFSVCLNTVHIDFIKKQIPEVKTIIIGEEQFEKFKSINIRQSKRKGLLFENDTLIKYNSHNDFIITINTICQNVKHSVVELLNIQGMENMMRKAKDIFGIN